MNAATKYDMDDFLNALHCIPADMPRKDWASVVMEAKAAGLTAEQVEQWSAQADNYEPAGFRDTWRSFKEEGARGAGSLIWRARQHGWQPDSQPKRPSLPPAASARADFKIQQEAARKPAAPGMSAAEVWSRCQPATNAHGYIMAKEAHGAPLQGLRVVPAGDPLRVAGMSMAGALAVPAYNADGELQSLQFIPPPEVAAQWKAAGKPGKLNLTGAPMTGAMHIVGRVEPGAVAYVVEGIGQAWACWRATGRAAVVAFGAGNVKNVAAALKHKQPGARLVLVADAGQEKDFEEAARALSCGFVPMPEDFPKNYDAADMIQSDGAEILADWLEMEARYFDPPRPLLVPVDVAGIWSDPSPPPEFVWGQYLPRGTTTLFSAHGGTGKSYIGLMMAVSVAAGLPLLGVETSAAPAIFVSLEDGAHIVRHRLGAICRALNIEPSRLAGRLHIVDGTENPELYQADNRNSSGEETAAYAELLALVKSTGAGLVVIDNASDAYGGDEIVRRQVRGFIRSLNLIAKHGDAAVVLLSHVNAATSRANRPENEEGYSGSTAWHNSVRSRLFMSRERSGLLKLEHQKSNLGKKQQALMIEWPEDGLPRAYQAPEAGAAGYADKLLQAAEARHQDSSAAEVLKLLAEYESREQFASPTPTARNNVHAILKADPQFKRLKLNRDDVAAIVTQAQRAGWIEVIDYRTKDRKERERWTVTNQGKEWAGLSFAPSAPSAPSALSYEEGAESARRKEGAPSAPSSYRGDRGEESAEEGAQEGALSGAVPTVRPGADEPDADSQQPTAEEVQQ